MTSRRRAWSMGIGLFALLAPLGALGQEAERRHQRKAMVDFDDDVVTGQLDGKVVAGDAAGKLGAPSMRRANRVAAELLEHRMRQRQPDDLKLVREAAAADIIVVQGSYDRVEDVLRAVKVRHVVIPPRLLERVPLMSLQTVMVNCPGKLGSAAHASLRRFVKTGGYLVTTDWALADLERILPGYVARGGRNTQNDVVQVRLHGADPLLSHVLASGDHPRWWLETASYPIRVLDRRKVSVLVSSAEMAKKYGQGVVAVSFRHDDGRVLHMTSHFYLQQARLQTARERARGSEFAKAAGVDGTALKKLQRGGLDTVQAGELNSAYAMQQLTTNLLVAKAKENQRLLGRFPLRARRVFALQTGPAASAPALKDGQVKVDYLLAVVEQRGKRIKVKDLFGREGWTDEGNVIRR